MQLTPPPHEQAVFETNAAVRKHVTCFSHRRIGICLSAFHERAKSHAPAILKVREVEGTAMWNIVWGLICVGGGASGQLALRGTNSTGALVAVGGALIAYGIYQMVQARNAE